MGPAAVVHVRHEGYGDERVASTTALIVDGNRNIITDPGCSRAGEPFSIRCSPTWVRTSDSSGRPCTPAEDITTVAPTAGGVVAFTHLWKTGPPVGDRHAADLAALHLNRERVLAFADLVVPGHGPAFEPSPRTPR
jgi:hypothetical protein